MASALKFEPIQPNWNIASRKQRDEDRQRQVAEDQHADEPDRADEEEAAQRAMRQAAHAEAHHELELMKDDTAIMPAIAAK